MKNKRYSKTIYCDVYDTDYLFVIGGTPRETAHELAYTLGKGDQFKERIDTAEEFDPRSTTLAMAISLPDTRSKAVWIPEIPKTPRQIGSVAHEALHITTALMLEAGIDWSVHGTGNTTWVNDEPMAYLIGFFVREFMDFANGVSVIEERRAKRRKAKG